MTNGKLLCLNMIVKNEMANLERCLSAVADHVACWVIGDTGSSDGTREFITSLFRPAQAARGAAQLSLPQFRAGPERGPRLRGRFETVL